MRHHTIWAFGLLAAIALVIPVLADDATTQTQPKTLQADTNGDGKVSLDEAKARFPKLTEERFKQLDANADGFLTPEEMPKRHAKAAKAIPGSPNPKGAAKAGLFERADANNDGKLTFDEVSAAAPKFTKDRFDKVDKNADGVVTKEEFAAMRQHGEGGGAKLMAADANNDGKVSLEEIKAKSPNFPADRFDKLDANKDGFLTKDELPKAVASAEAAPTAPASAQSAQSPSDKFKQADADKNGEVTFAEVQTVSPAMTQEQFSRMDKNADGVITPDEAPKAGQGGGQGAEPMLKLAKQADVDQNGKVTFEEMHKVAPDMTQERFNQLDANKDGVLTMEDRQTGDKKAKGADPAARADAIKKLQAADANGDGKVTLEEAQAAKPGYPKEAFDRFDSNKDGVITTGDLPAAN